VNCTGVSSFAVKIEVDSNDITEHPHNDKLMSLAAKPYRFQVNGEENSFMILLRPIFKHKVSYVK